MMYGFALSGILLPFAGTVAGSSFVFFMKKPPGKTLMLILDSFAAGVMCAASFFSLISPATEAASSKGKLALFLCYTGFFTGMIAFIFLDKLIRVNSHLKHSGKMLMWAVSLHNIPEGMAVGVVYADILRGSGSIGLAAAFSLSLGIALQNIPEGAIISMPLKARGKSTSGSFFSGVVSGLAELGAGVLTLFLSAFVSCVLPFSLCFAAGAMFYVVMSELSKDFSSRETSGISLFIFALGFTIMMLLDTLCA